VLTLAQRGESNLRAGEVPALSKPAAWLGLLPAPLRCVRGSDDAPQTFHQTADACLDLERSFSNQRVFC